MLKDSIGFDIETIPGQAPWILEMVKEKIAPPGNISKPETIEKWWKESAPEAIEEAYKKTCFSGATNHIIALSYTLGGEEVIQRHIEEDLSLEGPMIAAFFQDIEDLQARYGLVFYGHNIIGFDLRVIKQRAMVLGVKIPAILSLDPKPWDKNVYDTMLKWGNGRDYESADLLAKAFGLQGKGEMDGSKVYDYWKQGRYQEISDYCAADVKMTVEIYKKMRFIF